MNSAKLISSLEHFGRLLPGVVHDVSAEDARWKPADGAWSILEVVRHLVDEEVEDFRVRVRITLEDLSEKWPAIDPVGWATAREYNQGRVDDAAARFGAERATSAQWLRNLQNPDWGRAYQHPKFGPIHAGDLLTAWAAHDALHLRQISKRLFQIAQRDGGKYSTRYAGEWTA